MKEFVTKLCSYGTGSKAHVEKSNDEKSNDEDDDDADEDIHFELTQQVELCDKVDEGSDAKGSDAKGSDAKGSDAKGSDAKGSDAKGSDAKGSDAKGSDAKGSDAAVVVVLKKKRVRLIVDSESDDDVNTCTSQMTENEPI